MFVKDIEDAVMRGLSQQPVYKIPYKVWFDWEEMQLYVYYERMLPSEILLYIEMCVYYTDYALPAPYNAQFTAVDVEDDEEDNRLQRLTIVFRIGGGNPALN